jgi:hypothetical protein
MDDDTKVKVREGRTHGCVNGPAQKISGSKAGRVCEEWRGGRAKRARRF